ncbi:hypothetical protein KP509_24G052800 [Ceratopteris richardii]|uniref:Uncharacterized protein n=1 Tax=Ceratopteris richardii TaxID=49495 RepID=A0A8T2RX13_CERRI|nr:hypothetical protein KP509_24G052800 [Ceratopteris richardii]
MSSGNALTALRHSTPAATSTLEKVPLAIPSPSFSVSCGPLSFAIPSPSLCVSCGPLSVAAAADSVIKHDA